MPRTSVIFIALFFAAAVSAQADEELYRAACATCHGMDGRGAPPEALAFQDAYPADLTDCSFATREPDKDWFSVAHEGGPARAFAREMPAFGVALDRDQLQRAVDYARGFCTDRAWPRGELNFPRPFGTEKAFPEDEVVISTSSGPGGVSNKLIYEQRFGPRSQFELIVPFGWREDERPGETAAWAGGIGDVALGMKHVVHHSLRRGSIFSIAGEVKLPTGSERRGFGSGHVAIEPFVSFGQSLPASSFLHVQTGAEIPLDGNAPDEGFLRLAGGRTFVPRAFGRTWTPMLELLAAAELESPRNVHWDALPQIQISVSRRQHLLACVGVRVPLNDRSTTDPQFVMYLLWDWFDGGLTDGW